MNLYIVRHGETQRNREEVFRGRYDIPLNDNGKRQADRLGDFFKDKDIDLIYSSPLSRAIETAEGVRKYKKNVNINIEPSLIDMNFGAWEGLPLKEVEKRFTADFNIWKNHPQKWKIEGAESLLGIKRRISKFFQQLPNVDNIVIVTHRVICKIIILMALDLGVSKFWKIKIDPASVSLINKGEGIVLEYINYTGHLREGLRKDF